MTWIANLCGYAFAVFIGAVAIHLLVYEGLRKIGMSATTDKDAMTNQWTAVYIGVIERILYIAALQLGVREFIGFWLAVKVAGGWNRWAERRKIFHLFLIGSGYSILYSVVGFKMIGWTLERQWVLLMAIPSAVTALNIGMWIWLKMRNTCPNEPVSNKVSG
jgi:hypothetical protein